MPYVTSEDRAAIAAGASAKTVGQLTYVLTLEILAYLWDRGVKYQTIAEIVGALEQTKDEFQRRVVHPYETRKASENGDVYNLHTPDLSP